MELARITRRLNPESDSWGEYAFEFVARVRANDGQFEYRPTCEGELRAECHTEKYPIPPGCITYVYPFHNSYMIHAS